MYSPAFIPIKGKHTQAVNLNTTHTEHKAFQRPFVSLLNLTIVPPRQGTDNGMDGLIKATRSGSNAMYFHRECGVDEQSVVCMSLAESVLNLTAIASTTH